MKKIKPKKKLYYDTVLNKALTGVRHTYNSFFFRYKNKLIICVIALVVFSVMFASFAYEMLRNDLVNVNKTTVFVYWNDKVFESIIDSFYRQLSTDDITPEDVREQIDIVSLTYNQLELFCSIHSYVNDISASSLCFFLVDENNNLIDVYYGFEGFDACGVDLINKGYLEERK